MKWIVLIILSINLCNAQSILVEKKIIDFCNEEIDKVDTLTKIITTQDIIIKDQKSIINTDSTLFTRYKKDSIYLSNISNKKDSILSNKNLEVKEIKKVLHKVEAGAIIIIVIETLILFL